MELVSILIVLLIIYWCVIIMELVYNQINHVNVNLVGIIVYVINHNIHVTNRDVKEEVYVMLMELVVVIMELQQIIVWIVIVLKY